MPGTMAADTKDNNQRTLFFFCMVIPFKNGQPVTLIHDRENPLRQENMVVYKRTAKKCPLAKVETHDG